MSFQNASSTLKQVYKQKHPLATGAPEASLLHFVSMDWPFLEMSHKCNWTTHTCLIAMSPPPLQTGKRDGSLVSNVLALQT